jgi:hypothetical protein
VLQFVVGALEPVLQVADLDVLAVVDLLQPLELVLEPLDLRLALDADRVDRAFVGFLGELGKVELEVLDLPVFGPLERLLPGVEALDLEPVFLELLPEVLVFADEFVESFEGAFVVGFIGLVLVADLPGVPLLKLNLPLRGTARTWSRLENSLSLLFSVLRVSSPLTFSVSSLIWTS